MTNTEKKKLGSEIVMKLINETRKITICLAIWTKKALTASFLGISRCFFSETKQMPVHAFLALHAIQHPHTGEMVAECLTRTLENWLIPAEKVLLIISDNGSNMVKALKLMNAAADTKGKEEEDEENNSETTEFRAQEDEATSELSEDDDESDSNKEQQEHDKIENDPVTNIHDSIPYNRMACLSHSLQLVMKEIDKQPAYNRVMTKAQALVKKVKKSSSIVQKILNKTKKVLITSCPTRWNSSLLMLNRFLELKSTLNDILDEEGIDSLLASEWSTIDAICKILEPFAVYTNILQANCMALSSIVPAIIDLETHLEHVTGYKQLFVNMLKSLRTRFAVIMDPETQDFNPVPASATLLDPTLPAAILLPGKENLLAAARRFILHQVL